MVRLPRGDPRLKLAERFASVSLASIALVVVGLLPSLDRLVGIDARQSGVSHRLHVAGSSPRRLVR